MKYAKFFRYVQDSPWYKHFLDPIIEELSWLPDGAKILDIGTGPGKLLELGKVQSDLQWTGVDTDASMLAEAQNAYAATQRTAPSDFTGKNRFRFPITSSI